ncbi:MAG TPA: ABC transporter permease [Candidatus Angelobacter sp.]|nr:ABC transporter permease [Candidatus Angelobacter sp.]
MNFLNQLKFAFRVLRKSPGFTTMAVLMLALGIGASTAIFSIVEGVLLRPLPFPESNRLMALGDTLQGGSAGFDGINVTAPDVLAYTRGTHSFQSLGGYTQTTFELTGLGEPAVINAARFTAGVFPTLGVAPLMGRVFTQQDDDQKQQLAVLSYATWQSRFHGDPQVLGTKILLDRKPYIVIGVMPRNFEFPLQPGQLNRTELWVPMSFTHDELTIGAASWSFQMVGRLKPGVSPQQAQADAESVAQEIMRHYPSFISSLRISAVVRSLQEDTVRQARPLIRTLFLAVLVVLLIACANLAGLLLIRAIRRRREMAVRLALGARASALLGQAMIEGLVLSIAGSVLGLTLAANALQVGRTLLPETLPLIGQIRLDWKVALFALLLGVFTGVVSALAPAFASIRTSLTHDLKEGGRTGTSGAGHARLRSALVIAEIAVAMMLVSASGLLLRSFEKMRGVQLGFRPDHTLTAVYSLPVNQYPTQAAVDEFNKELQTRLEHLPGVTAVGMSSLLPESGGSSTQGFVVDGYVPPKGAGLNLAWAPQVVGNYFQAMGIALQRGRVFTEADNARSQLVVVVNHKLAEHYWPGQDPIGKRIRWGVQETPTPWMTVVGEVDDVKQDAPDQDTREQVYQPAQQALASFGSVAASASGAFALSGNNDFIVLRTALPPKTMQNAMLSTVHSIDSQLPLTQMQTMEHAVSATEAPRRFNTWLITAFAIAGILLALLGIYSIIAFTAALRTQEMAIRMALGSQRSGILRLMMTAGARLAIAGCVLGVAGALFTSRLLRTFLFGVSPFDPLVLALAAAFVLLLAMGVSLLPARRAASTSPMQALRAE